jgi:hypothetical protein
MRFLVGDECGLLKEITLSKRPKSNVIDASHTPPLREAQQQQQQQQQRIINPKDGMTRKQGIVRMVQFHNNNNNTSCTDQDDTAIAALRYNGTIQLWQPSSSSSSSTSTSTSNNKAHSDQIQQQQQKQQLQKNKVPTRYTNVVTLSNVFSTTKTTNRTNQNQNHNHNQKYDSRERPLDMGYIRSATKGVLVVCSTNGTLALLEQSSSSSTPVSTETTDTVYRSNNHPKHNPWTVSTVSTTTIPNSGPSTTTTTRQSSTTNTKTKTNLHPSNSNLTPRISTFAIHPNKPYVVMGGKDRDMVLYDITTFTTTATTATTATTTTTTSDASAVSVPVPLWRAKNLPPHPQTLLPPLLWPTACCFLSTENHHHTIGPSKQNNHDNNINTNSSNSSSSHAYNPNILVVGTAHQQIRIYDIRTQSSTGVGTTIITPSSQSQPQPQSQRRPILYTNQPILDYRITALCPSDNNSSNSGGHTIIVGDAGGTMVTIDLRQLSNRIQNSNTTTSYNTSTFGSIHTSNGILSKSSAIVGRFVGPTGCITEIVPYGKHHIASVGYDRMVRIYNVRTMKSVHTVYCQQRLNCIVPLINNGDDDDIENDDNDDDDDDAGDSDDDGQSYNEDDPPEDNVQDYVDSDNDDDEELLLENEEDIVAEMMNRSKQQGHDDDDDQQIGRDGNDESEDESNDNDDSDVGLDDDENDSDDGIKEPIRKRNRR